MPVIRIESLVAAPIELCFDLSRDVDLHMASTKRTNELAVAGVTSGLIGPGEEVTWEATHFGIRQRLTSRITAFDRPNHFRDSQVRGAFRRFDHDHFFFEVSANATRCLEVFDFKSPMGWLGVIVDRLVLTNYMRKFLEERLNVIKEEAESEGLRRPSV